MSSPRESCYFYSVQARIVFLVVGLALLLGGCEQYGKPSLSIEVAAKGVHAGAIDDSGRYAVVGSIHHGGSYWAIEENERLFNWNHKPGMYSTIVAADLSERGEWALTTEPHTIVLWDTKKGTGERFWTAPGEILDAELGPGANVALLGLDDHSAVIFDVRNGGIRNTFRHSNRVRSVDLSRDGRLALTGSEDYTAALWDVASGEQLKSFKHEDDVQLVKLSPDGSLALSVSKYDRALVWSTDTGDIVGEVPLKAEYLKRGIRFTSARFSADNRWLLTGRPDQIVELWDVQTLANIERWKVPKRSAWKPSGSAIIDIAFGEGEVFYALVSNGFIHQLER